MLGRGIQGVGARAYSERVTKANKTRLPSSLQLVSPSGSVCLAADAEGEAGSKKRKISMSPAYSGAPVSTWFGRMIVDLDGMELPKGNMALLQEHSPSQRAGVGRPELKGGVLSVSGELLSNPVGDSIAQDAADGFPFQSSIGFDINRWERIKDGDSKTVNGQEFAGPGYVVTKSTLRETSVVALGADGSTETQVFSRGGTSMTFDHEEEVPMTPEEFAAKHPEAVAAWKREGEEASRAELGAMLEALPDRSGFVAAQFAAGATAKEIKVAAALAAEIGQEGAQLSAQATEAQTAQATAQQELAAAKGKIQQLTRQPGVAFSASEDGQIQEPGDSDELSLTDEQLKARFAASRELQAEFGGREGAYLAWTRKARRDAVRA